MKQVIRIGSRESKLAVIQTELVKEMIQRVRPEVEVEIITMKTTGDRILNQNLDKIGGKGLFVKELDLAMKNGEIDLAVHSLKDVPMELAEGMELLCYPKREDPRDALILRPGMTELGNTGVIGTSSRRRMEQLKKRYPGFTFRGIRGNVQTRLNKLETEGYDATILAAAGLKRLGMESVITQLFSVDQMIPAAGQGILAVQGRKGEFSWLKECSHEQTRYAALAERAFIKTLNGGCTSPVAAHAIVENEEIRLKGLYWREEDQQFFVEEMFGTTKDAKGLGKALAEQMERTYQYID